MNERIDGLIGRLKNFRTRSAAADALIAMGPTAVEALAAGLERPDLETARWTMLNCLGEIGDPSAVAILAPFLDTDDYRSVAHDGLVKIAGRDLGHLAADWTRWAEHGGVHEAPAEAEEPDTSAMAKLMCNAMDGVEGEWRSEADGRFAVDLDLPGGRGKQVIVTFGSTDHEGSEIVIIYAVCCEAGQEDHEAVLRRNLRMPYGAVGLRDIGDKPHFVMFNTILRRGLSPEELRKSIVTVGSRSDGVARQLGG